MVAHRGASAELDENTLAAFDLAVELGADAVEFDVRLTADGVPVVHHDPGVDRTTDGSGPIAGLTAEQMRRLRTAGGHAVPTLEDALERLSGRVAIDVEIKNIPGEPDYAPDEERVVEATVAALAATAFAGPVLVSSFNPRSLAACRAFSPETPTGLLTTPSVSGADALLIATSGGHPWVLPFVQRLEEGGPRFVEACHDAAVRVGTWLTDEPAVAVRLMRLGVDAVATNDPRRILAARREAFGA